MANVFILTSLDISEVNTVWTWGGQTSPPPISKYFNKKRGPSGIRTRDLPHDSQRRYPLRCKNLDADVDFLHKKSEKTRDFEKNSISEILQK